MRLRQWLQRDRPNQSAQLCSLIVSSITCKSHTAPPAICRVPADGTDRLERVLEAPSEDHSSAVHGLSNDRATGLERRACWLSDVSAGGRLDCLDPDYFKYEITSKEV